MYPRLFSLDSFPVFGHRFGPFTLHTYGVLLAVAFLAGLIVTARQARKAGLDANRVTDMAVYVLIAGLLGAKVMLVLVEWRYYSKHIGEVFSWSVLQSGGVFYGGLLAALPVAWWYARRHHLDAWQTADVLSPGVVIGQAIGRLGCLAAGCCFGRPTNVAWAITFRDVYASRQTGTPVDTPLHPTQIYESLAAFAIFAFLIWLSSRRHFPGQIVIVYVALYSVARFVIEFFRGDPARGTVFGGVLSTSQFVAILLLLGVAAAVPYRLRKGHTGGGAVGAA